MQTLVFDIEGNGLLREVTKLWCLVIIDAATGEVKRYNEEPCGEDHILHGLARLHDCALSGGRVVAHNGVGYDFPTIEKLYGITFPDRSRFDTMVLGRLFNPERNGGHSIESYGESFGIKKDTGADDFTQWSQRLEDRCVDDARTTYLLWQELTKRNVLSWGRSPEIEHRFAELIALQMENGVSLNERLAIEVAAECQQELTQLQVQLQEAFPPIQVVDKIITPKRDNAKLGYKAGVPVTKYKTQEFNPGSGMQIAARLTSKYGWEPKKFTESGIPATDEEVLKNLEYPEAKLLARYARVDKMWKQIAAPKKKDGSGGGWLHHINPKTGRVHGYVNSNGAVTGRCTHSRPNTANVDKKDLRLREMWIPRAGWNTLLGADAEGLELRMLGHYLARWDEGAYSMAVVTGDKAKGTDVHTRTIRILAMVKRDNGKRVIYAMIYGAGDAKLGIIIIEDALEADTYALEKMPHLFKVGKGGAQKKRSPSELGAEARAKLETGITGLGDLKAAILERVKTQGWITGLDGRRLRIRSAHSALNTLLQSGGAVVMKLALILFHREASKRFKCSKGWKHEADDDYGYCLNVHDEVQIECRTREIAETLGPMFAAAITEAGKQLGVRCPLSGSYDIGENWSCTH